AETSRRHWSDSGSRQASGARASDIVEAQGDCVYRLNTDARTCRRIICCAYLRHESATATLKSTNGCGELGGPGDPRYIGVPRSIYGDSEAEVVDIAAEVGGIKKGCGA